ILNVTANTVHYTLSLHAALPILTMALVALLDAVFDEYERHRVETGKSVRSIKSFIQLAQLALALVAVVIIISILIDRSPLIMLRSEEHTSELQSRENLVCRLLLE